MGISCPQQDVTDFLQHKKATVIGISVGAGVSEMAHLRAAIGDARTSIRSCGFRIENNSPACKSLCDDLMCVSGRVIYEFTFFCTCALMYKRIKKYRF